jgi:hypothetical protein
MNNYVESKKKLDSLRNKNEMLFRMAISHLMDVGIRHLTEENIESTCEEIMKEDDKHSFMTNTLQCDIVRTAGDIAKIDHIHVLTYISREIYYDVRDNGISYQRAMQIVRYCLCYTADCYGSYRLDEEEALGKFRNIGLTDEEVEYFGWKELLEAEEEREDDY